MRTLWMAAAVGLLALGCKEEPPPKEEFVDPLFELHTDGLWHDNEVDVQGVARGLTEVTINDNAVQRDGDAYSYRLRLDRGVNVVIAEGVDGHGDRHVLRQGLLSGDYEDASDPIEEAMAIRLNQTGLQKMSDIASGLVVAHDIETLAMGFNPVYQDHYGAFGLDAVTINADLTSIDFDAVQVTPDPRPGFLDLHVVIPNLDVQVNTTGEVVLIDFDQDVWVGADAVVIDGSVLVSVDGAGKLDIQLVNSSIDLQHFWWDFSLLPTSIVEDYFADSVRATLEEILLEQMNTLLPTLLEDQLADFDISYGTDVLGKGIVVSADFSSVTVDEDGLEIGTNINVLVDEGPPRDYEGYLYAPAENPEVPHSGDISMSISDNLLNNVFFQMWRAGVMALDLDSARGELEPIFLAQLGAMNAAHVVVDAVLPPVVIESDGKFQAQITELLVHIETPGGTNGEFVDIAVTAYIDLELTVVDGVLKVDLGEPDLVLDVRDSDWGVDENTLTNVLVEELPINTLLALLGSIEFPLPSLAGISISNADAYRDHTGVFTSIEATL